MCFLMIFSHRDRHHHLVNKCWSRDPLHRIALDVLILREKSLMRIYVAPCCAWLEDAADVFLDDLLASRSAPPSGQQMLVT